MKVNEISPLFFITESEIDVDENVEKALGIKGVVLTSVKMHTSLISMSAVYLDCLLLSRETKLQLICQRKQKEISSSLVQPNL